MKTDPTPPFIREKIYQIRSALMYSMSNELIRIPNNIVTVLRLDDEGQLWFLCKRPSYPVEQCEQIFPVRLVFYRKGIAFSLEVSGKATIVNDEESLMALCPAETLADKPVLMRMTMMNLEFSGAEEKKKSWFEGVAESTYRWMLHTFAVPRHSKSVFHKLHHSIPE